MEWSKLKVFTHDNTNVAGIMRLVLKEEKTLWQIETMQCFEKFSVSD